MSKVYFVECAGRIKIGFSNNVQERLRQLSTGVPGPRGKTKYETYEKAKRGARRLKGLVSYHCRFCHGWHNGNRLDR